MKTVNSLAPYGTAIFWSRMILTPFDICFSLQEYVKREKSENRAVWCCTLVSLILRNSNGLLFQFPNVNHVSPFTKNESVDGYVRFLVYI